MESGKPASTTQPEAHALRILVVEDNPQVNELLCDMLDLLGHRARGALSAEQALPMLEQDDYDLLLTDIRLPGMSGIDLAKRAKQMHGRLFIVFSSGYNMRLSGHLDFDCNTLCKPYDIEKLQALLQSLKPRAR